MHVLITGGAGFIGSHLVELHLARGDQVHVVDDLSTGTRDNLASCAGSPGLRFDRADVLRWDGLDGAAAWADRIYHLAAVVGMFRVLSEPIEVLATNIAGTERLLRAIVRARWKPRLLVASSSEVYGPRQGTSLEESSDLVVSAGGEGRWNYAVSKLADEALATSYAREHVLHIVVARLFNTIGPRQTGRYGMVVPRFVEQATSGGPITVFGSGEQSRCFCDVRDTVRALAALLESPHSAGQIVNVGHDREVAIRELAEMVRRRAGSGSAIETIPYRVAYGDGYQDIPRRRPCLERLVRLTGFRSRFTLEDTLDLLIAARRSNAAAGAARETG